MDQERLAKLEATVELIKDNHLAHMAKDIERLERKVDKLDARLWLILVGVLGIIITIAVERLF